MRHKNFLPFGVAFMFGAMGLSCLEHELWGVIIAHLVWLPLFVGLQTHYDEVVVLTTIEANTHTYHLKTVARSFVMAMCIIPIALMASHSRYGWLALGTDYLWLWFLVSFLNLMVIGWQLGITIGKFAGQPRRFRLFGISFGAGIAYSLYRLIGNPESTDHSADLAASLIFAVFALYSSLKLTRPAAAAEKAASRILMMKGALLLLFFVYAALRWNMFSPPHPLRAALPVGILGMSVFISGAIMQRRLHTTT
jgi:hypothetical protein